MAKNANQPARQPHVAWRISRVALHILGKVLLWAMIITSTVAVIAAVAGVIFMTKFSDYLKRDVIPKSREYAEMLDLDSISSLSQSSIIYYQDRATGEYRELQQLYAEENRIWVSYDKIPQDMVHAAVAIEDKRYPDHSGVDWLRTLSAVRNFIGGDSSFGASTITQQLIKNRSHDNDVTVNRKVQEIFRALAVEELYGKNEIMEWYLNTIYLGEGCYGIQSAAEVYFAKDVSELTTAECASLIAITNNPSLFDPYLNETRNRERQLTILNEMYAQGYLDADELEQAKAQEMVFHNGLYDAETYVCASCGFEGTRSEYEEREEDAYFCRVCGTQNFEVDSNNAYSYTVDTVYRDVVDAFCEKFDISEAAAQQKLLTGGYRIYATVDPELQAVVDRIYENADNVPNTVSTQQLQSAIILIDNTTGDIVAMSGGIGEKEGSLSLNRATQSRLPTGSSIKPLAVYAPALEAGLITPATAFEDSPMTDDGWPLNAGRSYSGPCLVLRGLMQSLNTISAKTLKVLGPQNSYDFLTQKLGITTLVDSVDIGGVHYSDIDYSPLALGEQTYGLTVREMAQAYAVFPNGGVFRKARTFTKVTDQEGKVIIDNTQESHTAVSVKTNYYINYMLQSAVASGTGAAAYRSNMAIAGKTGTSSNNQAYWFAGYTPYYTAVTWCGYDQPEQIVLSDSYTNPGLVMWNQVMDAVHQGLEYRSFDQPDGVGYYDVCSDCGMLATDACKADVREGANGKGRVTSVRLFYEDAPQKWCECHAMVKICKESGKIANEFCEHAHGNSVEEVGMLIYNEDWKVHKEEPWVYNAEDKDAICSIHNAHTAQDPEPTTEPTTEPDSPPSSEPAASLPPDDGLWFNRKRILTA